MLLNTFTLFSLEDSTINTSAEETRPCNREVIRQGCFILYCDYVVSFLTLFLQVTHYCIVEDLNQLNKSFTIFEIFKNFRENLEELICYLVTDRS